MTGFSLSIIIKAVDQATAPLRRIADQLNNATEPVRRLGSSLRGFNDAAGIPRLTAGIGGVAGAMRGVSGEAMLLAGRMSSLASGFGLLGAGGIYAFKTQFLDVSAQFERFETILGTVEGSSDKAKGAMSWISDFATSTPYELNQVTDAYVKLRSYGLNPTNGLLRTLGDTSAAMGKPLMQTVEAIADAVTGENERLKEFGIRASKVGSQIVYEYTDAAGKTQRKAVAANNRNLIESVLKSIWNDKYAGSMDKLSGTWDGMMSNLSDQWTRFSRMLMDGGAFDWLKTQLKELLDTIDSMAASGELQQLAQDLGGQLRDALIAVKDAGIQFAAWVRETWPQMQTFAQAVGGWGNVLKGVAFILAGPFIVSLLTLGQAFVSLGMAMWATPIGWVVAGIAAIVTAAVLLYTHWDTVTAKLQQAWAIIKEAFWSLVEGIAKGVAQIADLLPKQLGGEMAVKLKAFAELAASNRTEAQSAMPQSATGAATVRTGAGDVMRANAGAGDNNSKTEVLIKAENLPQGMSVRVGETTADRVSMDLGRAMAGP
ncbi:tape measure protein [Ferrovibrio terrae]|uniref:tape measure protein n=1 Tax=Ferrovibrio terrae TaxID=2594003 RepID=UPI003138207D